MTSALSGTVTVDANNISDTVNNSMRFTAQVTSGLADNGSFIGSMIGLAIGIGSVLLVIGAGYLIVDRVLNKTKGISRGI